MKHVIVQNYWCVSVGSVVSRCLAKFYYITLIYFILHLFVYYRYFNYGNLKGTAVQYYLNHTDIPLHHESYIFKRLAKVINHLPPWDLQISLMELIDQ